MSTYPLDCQLENEESFPVNIDPNKTVGGLEEYIKKRSHVLSAVDNNGSSLKIFGGRALRCLSKRRSHMISCIAMLIDWCFGRWTNLTAERLILQATLLKIYITKTYFEN